MASSLIEIEIRPIGRREIEIDKVVAHLIQGCRLPGRTAVLIDNRGTHAFEEIMSCHEMAGQAVFDHHRAVEVEGCGLSKLTKGDPQSRGGFLPQGGGGIAGPNAALPV